MPEAARNHVALGLLILAKAFGMAGLVLGSTHRFAGGSLLALDGVLLVAAVVIALRTARAQHRADAAGKEVLARMMREGTLDQYLRELREEAAE